MAVKFQQGSNNLVVILLILLHLLKSDALSRPSKAIVIDKSIHKADCLYIRDRVSDVLGIDVVTVFINVNLIFAENFCFDRHVMHLHIELVRDRIKRVRSLVFHSLKWDRDLCFHLEFRLVGLAIVVSP